MIILDTIDDVLNEVTMYRLLIYGLSLFAAVALVLAGLGSLSLSLSGLLVSFGVLSVVCYGANYLLAKAWGAITNHESALITTLILFFILPPATTAAKALAIGLTGLLAIAAKYMLAWRYKHIFNPAAFGAFLVGVLGLVHTSWWIGSSLLWPMTLIVGLLIVRKVRRFSLVTSFALTSVVVTAGMAVVHHTALWPSLKPALIASPLIFLGTIMLTEPSTMPPDRRKQMIFGGLVGALYSLHYSLGSFAIYPETALLLGNIYAFAVSNRAKWNLVLKDVEAQSSRVRNFVFTPDKPITFRPGQYMEWTLPGVSFDQRGNRRTFTIASSPTEDTVQLGAKFYEPSSAFKKVLSRLQPGDRIVAGQVAGSFYLPEDQAQKLLFIAGGIGITPFRSMLKYLLDRDEQRDIILLYFVATPEEISYRKILKAAQDKGVKIVPIVSAAAAAPGWQGAVGHPSKELFEQYVPDLKERRVYISGPNAMVKGVKRVVQQTGIPRSAIVTDYFSGY
jgi:ferredoxin-NADP reductase/Na+-translocating ferredoxin:NAD+ oxidoreductase RnfD subunit